MSNAIFRQARSALQRFAGDTSGSIALLFAAFVLPAVALVGITVDYVRATTVRSQIQSALDASVLAAAHYDTSKQPQIATSYFHANFKNRYGATATPSFTPNPDGSISGSVTTPVPTTFAKVLGIDSLQLDVESSAGPVSANTTTAGGLPCILVLDDNAYEAFRMDSPSSFNASKCEVHVRSTSSSAARIISASSTSFKKICIKGEGSGHSAMENNCNAADDVYAGKLPAVTVGSCNYNNKTVNGSSMSPGVYCGTTNINGEKVTMQSGLYVFTGGKLHVNSKTIKGTGVTWYFAGSSSGIGTYKAKEDNKLTAPTSGTYKGILMFEESGLPKRSFLIHSADKTEFDGLIYLPSWDLTIDSMSEWDNANEITMVVNTLDIISASSVAIEPYAWGDPVVTLPGQTTSTTSGVALQ